ncbi:hypothetical protein HOK31_13520, partial [Candidatus Poribacteria bacterium]|nr:hypothetical protein [Candidatus Poribacteria bacterium]
TLSSEATPVALALIDVMLGARAGEGDGPFTLENTHNFTRTGIRLLELLRARRPGTFPERAVFFSMAASEELVAAITDVSDRQGVPYLRKDAYDTPYQFCLHIAEILHDLDG